MDSPQLNVVKVENQNERDWLYIEEEQLKGTLEVPATLAGGNDNSLSNTFLEFDPSIFPHQSNQIPHFDFKDFEGVTEDLCSWDDNFPSYYDEEIVVNANPVNTKTEGSFDHCENVGNVRSEVANANDETEEVNKRQSGRWSKSATLELDEIQKYFDVPIMKAAKELNVGSSILKKKCRELNISRWPHRKIKSLQNLIQNMKGLGLGTADEVEMLEEQKRMIEKEPELELTERAKKLRIACAKANYKRRRALAAAVQTS